MVFSRTDRWLLAAMIVLGVVFCSAAVSRGDVPEYFAGGDPAPIESAPVETVGVEPLYSLDENEWAELVGDDAQWFAMELPAEIRAWYRNPDGSCVQCSIGMCGADQNCRAAASLLWDSSFGPKVRGGSNPQRVAAYCNDPKRAIEAWNITGDETFAWMAWACRNGRGAAIGAGTRHFQTLYGHNPERGLWAVCNNNSTHKIDIYNDAAFRRLHLASGRWCVVLDYPPHPRTPRYVAWWQ